MFASVDRAMTEPIEAELHYEDDQKCEFLVTGTAGSIYEVDREVCSGGGIGPPCCTYMLYVHTYGFSRPEKKHAKNIIVGLMEHFAVSVVEVEMKADQIPVNHRTKPESGGDRPVGCQKMPTSPGSCRQSNNHFHCTCGRELLSIQRRCK